jgi:serine/threonine protein kinase
MPLVSGTSLGPYEILVPIGAGGMSEVYRANDPRMGREVATKIVAEQFSERFSREVRAVAALSIRTFATSMMSAPTTSYWSENWICMNLRWFLPNAQYSR